MAHVPAAGSLAALLTFSVMPAEAMLGEQFDAPATRSSVAGQPAAISHARVLPSGTRVVEYADLHGTVFAVSWSGPYLPDLRGLLGRHFASFTQQQQQQQQQRALHAAVVLRSSEVVIVSSGRMGAFEGRAWLPPRLPQGFDPGAL